MRKEFEENEESENKSENNLETQDEIDDETCQKILEKEFIEREKRITAALFADDDVEDIKFTKEELDNSYQEFCDETLIFASMEHLEYGNIISPQFPILLVLDVLYAHYLQIDRSKKEALHEYTIQTLQPHLIK